MRIAIVSTTVPTIAGGGSLIVSWTAEALRQAGHQVEEFMIPFPTSLRTTMPAMVGLRAMPFGEEVDRLVAIRWPAHLIAHPNKATWFIHHYRPLFDLWDTEYRPVRDDAEGRAYREALREMDNRGLRESADVFANSDTVRRRLAEYNEVQATTLFPPLGGDVSRFRTDGYGDTIVYASRVTPIKRQLLAVQAMRHVTTPVRLVIAGRADPEWYGREIEATIKEYDLQDRVELRLGWLPEAEKVDLLASCLAVAYLPLDEDSYGYPALEASHSAKAVVTLSDAGGALEFVRHGIEGLVSDPRPEALAAAFDQLYEDRQGAQRMGEASAARRGGLDINWENVVRRLAGTSA